MKSSSRIHPAAGIFIGIMAVSTASLFIRFAQVEAPSIVIAAGRLSIATLILAPFLLRSSISELRTLKVRSWLLLMSAGVFLGLHFVVWITSLEYTSVASSVVLVATSPLWVALLSPVFLKEKITRWVMSGLIISLAGSVIVGINGVCQISSSVIECIPLGTLIEGRSFLGNLLALAGAFFSCGYLLVGRRVRKEISIFTYTFIVYGIAAIVLLLLVLFSGQSLAGYSGTTYLWIFLLAVVPQLIGHSTFNYLLKYLSAASVSISLLGEPVGTVILAYLFLHESPTVFELTGGLLILLGIGIANRAENRKRSEPSIENDKAKTV